MGTVPSQPTTSVAIAVTISNIGTTHDQTCGSRTNGLFYDLMMRPGEGFGNILSFVDAIFCRLAISNGDILGFFKIPNFDDDISSVLETDSQTWVGHTPCTVFCSSQLCCVSIVWRVVEHICIVLRIEIFICWEFYSPLSGLLGFCPWAR